MKKVTLLSLLFITYFSYTQEYLYIDFGSTDTPGNWNNFSYSDNISAGLINSTGGASGITLTTNSTPATSFRAFNPNGTQSPDASLPFPETATRDSFYGTTQVFGGTGPFPDGTVEFTGLDNTKYYSFSIFASRSATDNREAKYTIIGSTVGTATLDAASNAEFTADIYNIQPTGGKITLLSQSGDNNTNSLGFYYLGAMRLIISDSPIDPNNSDPDPELTLVYPNGENIWEVGKTVRIKWESVSIPSLAIELSTDNGITWVTISTELGLSGFYDFLVPNQVSESCLIRVSGENIADTSDNTFEIVKNEGLVCRIVVLGSSTAAGAGPSNPNNAWVNKYRSYLAELDTRYEVINLAVGGFTTYNILPTGTTIPIGVNKTINTQKNITKALELTPDGIIINLPSNDAANGYSVANQIDNYSLIGSNANTENVPLWVTTPQPRNFGSNINNLNIQMEMITETYNTFGEFTIDFWSDLGLSNNNGILPQYNSDGVHMNDTGHQILFERVVDKGVHTVIKNNKEALNVDGFELDNDSFRLFPNPISTSALLRFSEPISGEVIISIIDMLGREVFFEEQKIFSNSILWSRNNIQSGFYLMRVSYGNKNISKRILIKN